MKLRSVAKKVASPHEVKFRRWVLRLQPLTSLGIMLQGSWLAMPHDLKTALPSWLVSALAIVLLVLGALSSTAAAATDGAGHEEQSGDSDAH